jgi:DNA polymerase III epsilon subunit-like protein
MDTTASTTPRPAQRYPAISALARFFGKPVWVVDLEATTGDLKDPQFGVVEVGYVLVGIDGSVTERSYLVDAGHPMNPYAERLTGIGYSDYSGQRGFASRWPEIEPLLRACVVSGFGIHDLDCKALFKEAERQLASPPERFGIDSLDARALWRAHSGSDKGQLAEVAQVFGHPIGQAHRALDDARAAASALDGLIDALGVNACAGARRSQWNPLLSMDQAAQAAEASQIILGAALSASAGYQDFYQGLAIMEAMGIRPHFSTKGLSWWTESSHAKWELAPKNPAELARHFGCPLPELMNDPDSLARCEALIINSHEPLGDEDAARGAMCRSAGTAAAARAKLIRSGRLPAWSGVDPAFVSFAQAARPQGIDERDILDALRAAAAVAKLGAGHPALSACAASIAIERCLPKRAEPARRVGSGPR